MIGQELNTVQLIAVAIIPTLFAIIIHEVAHGWVAKHYGDNTAYMMGRLSLNPIKHIDPVGTILVPLLMIAFLGFAFGWAKPVPIDWRNLRNPRRDMVLVAAAGPLSNFLMAIGWGLMFKLAEFLPGNLDVIAIPLMYMGLFGIFINVILMVFNLLPIPPLDGGRVAVGLLPPTMAQALSRVEPFGLLIIVALLATGFLWKIIGPVIHTVTRFINIITGI